MPEIPARELQKGDGLQLPFNRTFLVESVRWKEGAKFVHVRTLQGGPTRFEPDQPVQIDERSQGHEQDAYDYVHTLLWAEGEGGLSSTGPSRQEIEPRDASLEAVLRVLLFPEQYEGERAEYAAQVRAGALRAVNQFMEEF